MNHLENLPKSFHIQGVSKVKYILSLVHLWLRDPPKNELIPGADHFYPAMRAGEVIPTVQESPQQRNEGAS